MLPSGTRIGSCEVEGPLGAGGMGEVYRARDTRLDRTVAIKSLARAFAQDHERLARFEREAKLLASLNHPNVAAIYGLEESGGAPYLILEFVDGETLGRRVGRGALSVAETLDLAGQIAAGMEAAHAKDIVHRDLKPGNIMLTGEGTAKILDFGLARGGAFGSSLSEDLSASPTMALSSTREGIVLGTAPYMSPEQARGKPVDDRTDVWAFGCVIFECLTGRVTFGADTVPDAIARILERDPDWTALPSAMPQRLADLLKRCLAKNAVDRPRAPEVRSEIAAIRQEMSTGSAVMARPGGDKPSLAVLYFENLSNDPESDYFCAGITEDIITDLSKIRKIRVASRNAVTRYRGQNVDPSAVGTELGVGAVLEGSVRKAGDRVRISAQLINAADGFHLWAERYDRTLDDVFAVQEEIASAIAEALRVTLSPAETEKLGQDKPKDAKAYDLYLKGREQYNRYSKESLNEALKLFKEAIAVDPNYALAWAGVADCHAQLVQHGHAADAAERLRTGLEAAEHAIQLNPELADGYKAKALVLRYEGDLDGARAALELAIQANPRHTPSLINLAVGEYGSGNLAGAERAIRRALDADPQELFGTIWLAFICLETQRYDEALGATDRVLAQAPNRFYRTAVYGVRAAVAMERRDLEEVRRHVREGFQNDADANNLKAVEAWLAIEAGDRETAALAVDGLETCMGLGMGALLAISEVALRIGNVEAATRYMRREVTRQLASVAIRLHPAIHPLLRHPPFSNEGHDLPLVWPLEAPMIDAARFHVFKEVKIASGLPTKSQMSSG